MDNFLAECDRAFDGELQLYGTKYKSPGYHTTVPDGTWVRKTRANLGTRFGLVVTPALVIDGVIKSSGKLPSEEKLNSWLAGAKG